MRRLALVLTLAAPLALAACDREAAKEAGPPDAPPVFVHAQTLDLSGYYPPVEATTVGRWRLDHVFVGLDADFAAWEAGRREGAFAPVMLEFVDPSSPTVATEMGEVNTGRIRVLPTSYRIDDGAISFVGSSPELGEVSFAARLDADALASARRNLGDASPVMTATLTASGQVRGGLGLRWWAGD